MATSNPLYESRNRSWRPQ